MEIDALPELAPEGSNKAQKDQHINVHISSADRKLVEEKAAVGLKTGQLTATGSNLNQFTRLASAGQFSGVNTQTLNELLTRLLDQLK